MDSALAKKQPKHNLPPSHWLSKALAAVPDRATLAEHLNMTPQGLYSIMVRASTPGPNGKPLPLKAEYVPAIAALADVPPATIRPDLYSKEMRFAHYKLTKAGRKTKAKK